MSELENHQFEIVPTLDAFDGFVFGIRADVSVDEDGFDSGQNDWFTQDADNQRRGVKGFGRDVASPKTWTWSSHVNRNSVRQAVETLEQFEGAWTPDGVRAPGELLAVRYRLADRDRRIFGRPRRFSAPPTNRILGGYVPVTHDFQLVDSFSYDDIESSAVIQYQSSASGGGFSFPVTFPVDTVASDGNGVGQVHITGSARCYPVIRFVGPWTNPSFVTDDWTLNWKGTIPVGGWVEVDLRPWRLTVLNQSGASVVGGLDPRSSLEDYWFAPGSQPQITLQGIASAGGAEARVRWRNTYKGL